MYACLGSSPRPENNGECVKIESKAVGLLGPYGFGNLGDAAIQDAHMNLLASFCRDLRFIGISMNPADTEKRHGIASVAYDVAAYKSQVLHRPGRVFSALERCLQALSGSRMLARIANALIWRIRSARAKIIDFRHWIYVVRQMRQLDALIISGGGQLDEAWGGPSRHPYSLYKWCRVAKFFSKRVAFVSVGVGQVRSPEAAEYLRQALEIANYVSFRDEGSRDIVEERILRKDMLVVPDIAFGYSVQRKSGPVAGEGTQRVAIGPIPYFDDRPGSWSNRDAAVYSDYLERLESFCRRLLDDGFRLSFVVGNIDADNRVLNDLDQRLAMQGPGRAGGWETPEIATVADLIEVLAEADAVVTSRFHGAVLSSLLHKPILAISYERKIRQLMDDLSQTRYCCNIDDFDPGGLYALFGDLWVHRAGISRTIAEQVGKYSEIVRSQASRVAAEIIGC